jgi:hypothetical protein
MVNLLINQCSGMVTAFADRASRQSNSAFELREEKLLNFPRYYYRLEIILLSWFHFQPIANQTNHYLNRRINQHRGARFNGNRVHATNGWHITAHSFFFERLENLHQMVRKYVLCQIAAFIRQDSVHLISGLFHLPVHAKHLPEKTPYR